ncbi:MAG TPA: SIS domain-containing protein [Bryobacteraceae bacterium]|nr:SIS domain-containing protein [Bryobacteraceae bacterium]
MHRNSFDECAEVLAKTRANCAEPLESLVAKVSESLAAGGKILFFGNGGSASDAQHLATELAVRFVKTRRALASLALGSNLAETTACANDFGFERVFARQIEAIGAPGDVAIGLSTSGNSANVLAAIEEAKKRGIFTAAFTGESGGALKGVADLLIAVPSTATARIQEMHSLLGHILCEGIERELKL